MNGTLKLKQKPQPDLADGVMDASGMCVWVCPMANQKPFTLPTSQLVNAGSELLSKMIVAWDADNVCTKGDLHAVRTLLTYSGVTVVAGQRPGKVLPLRHERLITVGSATKNGADFCLAAELGMLMAWQPDAHVAVITMDKALKHALQDWVTRFKSMRTRDESSNRVVNLSAYRPIAPAAEPLKLTTADQADAIPWAVEMYLPTNWEAEAKLCLPCWAALLWARRYGMTTPSDQKLVAPKTPSRLTKSPRSRAAMVAQVIHPDLDPKLVTASPNQTWVEVRVPDRIKDVLGCYNTAKVPPNLSVNR